MLRRWLVALAALLVGGGTSLAMMAFANPDAGTVEVYVAARDIPAGVTVAADAVRLERVRLGPAANLSYTRERGAQLFSRRTGHELTAGQLIQRSDLALSGGPADLRLVLLPIHDLPVLAPGDRVDLLSVSGDADHLVVKPFMLGVEVRSQAAPGLVVAVSSAQAAALLYAEAAMHLAAVVATPGTAPGGEHVINDPAAAEREARR